MTVGSELGKSWCRGSRGEAIGAIARYWEGDGTRNGKVKVNDCLRLTMVLAMWVSHVDKR